jgi:pyruvate dehydrogenase E2 component (dihydrolipoamide acetyltransferase)
MQLIDILVPQLGEGLQEARIVKFLKEPGETVQRDEQLYQIETDKAVMEIESPHTGLHEWLVNEEEVIPVGSLLAFKPKQRGDKRATRQL